MLEEMTGAEVAIPVTAVITHDCVTVRPTSRSAEQSTTAGNYVIMMECLDAVSGRNFLRNHLHGTVSGRGTTSTNTIIRRASRNSRSSGCSGSGSGSSSGYGGSGSSS